MSKQKAMALPVDESKVLVPERHRILMAQIGVAPQYDNWMTCPHCDNDGWQEDPEGLSCVDGEHCPTCGGSGKVDPPKLYADHFEFVNIELELFMTGHEESVSVPYHGLSSWPYKGS